jgi:hypothetical protein
MRPQQLASQVSYSFGHVEACPAAIGGSAQSKHEHDGRHDEQSCDKGGVE